MKIFFPTFFSTRFLFYVCIKRIVHTTYIVQRKVYDKITNVVESSITNRFVGPKIVFFGLFLWDNIKKFHALRRNFKNTSSRVIEVTTYLDILRQSQIPQPYNSKGFYIKSIRMSTSICIHHNLPYFMRGVQSSKMKQFDKSSFFGLKTTTKFEKKNLL